MSSTLLEPQLHPVTAPSPAPNLIAMPTALPDVIVLVPRIYADDRGFFFESYNEDTLRRVAGITERFVQDNHTLSVAGVLRGLHYQVRQPQGKLVRVIRGEVFDVAVDVRKHSPTFGQWVGTHLSAANRRMLWIPPGYAHGFLTLSLEAECLYKVTDFYAPAHERTLLWNDDDVGIAWPTCADLRLSRKDRQGKRLKDADVYA